MGSILRGEIPALNNACETFTLGLPVDIHVLAGFKHGDTLISPPACKIFAFAISKTELPQTTAGFNTRFGEMTCLRSWLPGRHELPTVT